jgi:hypothetical protein
MLYPLFIVWLMSSCLWLAAAAGFLLARSQGYREASLACVLLAPICLVVGRASEAYWGWIALSFTVAILWWSGSWLFRRNDLQEQDRNHSSMRFSIRMLLALTAVIGWFLFVVVRTQRLDLVAWRSVFAISLVFALMAVLIEFIHYKTKLLSVVKRWLIRASAPLLSGLVLPLVIFDDFLPAFLDQYSEWPPSPAAAMFSFGEPGRARVWWFAIGALVALKMLLIPSPSLWSRHSTKHGGISAAMLIVIAAIPLWVGLQLMEIPQKDVVDSDRAEAYKELVSICNECERSIYASTVATYSEWDKVPSAEQQYVLQETAQLIDKLKVILERPTRIPLDYTINDISTSYFSSFRVCSKMLVSHAESKLIFDPDDALTILILNERLGTTLQKGGLLIDSLVGLAVSGTGRGCMKGEMEKFSPSARDQAALAIMRCLDEADSSEIIFARDRHWSNSVWWIAYVQNIARSSIGIQADQQFFPADVALARNIADQRLMVLELLLHNYHSQNGSYPISVDEVVISIYRSINMDPFSKNGDPFRYRTTEAGYILYSLGENGVDDGGEFMPEFGQYQGKDHSLERYLFPDDPKALNSNSDLSNDDDPFSTREYNN